MLTRATDRAVIFEPVYASLEAQGQNVRVKGILFERGNGKAVIAIDARAVGEEANGCQIGDSGPQGWNLLAPLIPWPSATDAMDVFNAANGSTMHWSSAEELGAPEAPLGNGAAKGLPMPTARMSASSPGPATAAGVTDRSLKQMLGALPGLFGGTVSAPAAPDDSDAEESDSEVGSMSDYPAQGAASSAAAACQK